MEISGWLPSVTPFWAGFAAGVSVGVAGLFCVLGFLRLWLQGED